MIIIMIYKSKLDNSPLANVSGIIVIYMSIIVVITQFKRRLSTKVKVEHIIISPLSLIKKCFRQ